MGGSDRAYASALIKFALFNGASDSSTAGLDCTSEDGTDIELTDVILGCVELAATTNAIVDLTSNATIIAGNKITVPTSTNDVIAVWWLSLDGEQQTASPFIKAEIAAGANADTAMTITGIETTDEIISCVSINTTTGAWTDQTDDMTISEVNAVECANSTATDSIFVIWMDRSGGKAFASLNLQFAIATVESSPSPEGDDTDFTLTGINDEDTLLVAIVLDETDGDILDELTSVSTVDADDSLRVAAPSPTAIASAKVLCFYQKEIDLAT